jgi:hypothetical protein
MASFTALGKFLKAGSLSLFSRKWSLKIRKSNKRIKTEKMTVKRDIKTPKENLKEYSNVLIEVFSE